MQQRLGIAQALVGDPRLVLLDEPTSALDPAGRRTVRELLDGLRDRGVAVLLNSHLLTEVELVCDRVVIVDRGRRSPRARPPTSSSPAASRSRPRAAAKRYPDAGREDIPDLIARLVADGERIYGARVVAGSLEDTYLGLVGAQES